jgi:hypothetical protein
MKHVCSVLLACCLLTGYSHARAVACSNASLNGGFGFSVAGNNLTLGVAFAISGRFTADGQGHFSGNAIENVAGTVSSTPFEGSYQTSKDCTGTAKFFFPGGVESNMSFVLVDNSNQLIITVTDQGTMESGTAQKQFPSSPEKQSDK